MAAIKGSEPPPCPHLRARKVGATRTRTTCGTGRTPLASIGVDNGATKSMRPIRAYPAVSTRARRTTAFLGPVGLVAHVMERRCPLGSPIQARDEKLG